MTTTFLAATAERAIKTFAQTLLALLGANQADILSVDNLAAVKVAGGAALLSVLTSFASGKIGYAGPSLAGETTVPDVITVTKEVIKEVEVPAKEKPKVATKVTDEDVTTTATAKTVSQNVKKTSAKKKPTAK